MRLLGRLDAGSGRPSCVSARVRYDRAMHDDVLERLGTQQDPGQRVVPRPRGPCPGRPGRGGRLLTAPIEALTSRHRRRRPAASAARPHPGAGGPRRVVQGPLALDPDGGGGGVEEPGLAAVDDRRFLEHDDGRLGAVDGGGSRRVVGWQRDGRRRRSRHRRRRGRRPP